MTNANETKAAGWMFSHTDEEGFAVFSAPPERRYAIPAPQARQCHGCAKNGSCAFDQDEIPAPCDFFVAGEPYLNASQKIDILAAALRGFLDSEAADDIVCDCARCRWGRDALRRSGF